VDAQTDSRRAPAGDSEAGVVAASVYAGGRRVKDIAIEEAGEWSKRPGHVVWIGLWEPSADLLQRVQAQLGLHYLAIEDAGKAHQHPKIEQYGEALFVVARTTQLIDGRIAFGETHLFVGRGYVVSVRHGARTIAAATRSINVARSRQFVPLTQASPGLDWLDGPPPCAVCWSGEARSGAVKRARPQAQASRPESRR